MHVIPIALCLASVLLAAQRVEAQHHDERAAALAAAFDTLQANKPSGHVAVIPSQDRVNEEAAARRLGYHVDPRGEPFALKFRVVSVALNGADGTAVVQAEVYPPWGRLFIETSTVTLRRRGDRWRAVAVRRDEIS